MKDPRENEPPADYVLRLAKQKRARSERMQTGSSSPQTRPSWMGRRFWENRVTIRRLRRCSLVYADARIRSTPELPASSERRLPPDRPLRYDVPMRDYSDEEINAYVVTGDPLDKAGAYAIQHRSFVPSPPESDVTPA